MFAFSAMSNAQQAKPIYLDDSKPIEERVENALSKMTLDEKIAMIHAQSKFSSPGVPRLGFQNFGLQMDLTECPEVKWDE
jgi:beta-glucosidase